jgi:hypothetical protein
VTAWREDEVQRIAESDDLHIAPVPRGRADDAYRAKYGGSPYLDPMIGPRTRSATVKVTPRDTVV